MIIYTILAFLKIEFQKDCYWNALPVSGIVENDEPC